MHYWKEKVLSLLIFFEIEKNYNILFFLYNRYCCQVGFVANPSTGTIIVLHTNTDIKP